MKITHVLFFFQQASILKHEKDMLVNAEKRALDEVRSLSERVYRLQVLFPPMSVIHFLRFTLVLTSSYSMQASLDTIQSTDEVREVV